MLWGVEVAQIGYMDFDELTKKRQGVFGGSKNNGMSNNRMNPGRVPLADHSGLALCCF